MLPGNIKHTKLDRISVEVKGVLEKKGKEGWLRVGECEKEYVARTPLGENKGTRRTEFFRWRKQIGNKVKGFQVVELPKNIVFIGLDSANPHIIESFIVKNKNLRPSIKIGFGLFDYLRWRKEYGDKKSDEKIRRLEMEGNIILEKMQLSEDDPKFLKKCKEIEDKWKKKYGFT